MTALLPVSSAREVLEACGVDPDVILADRARLRAAKVTPPRWWRRLALEMELARLRRLRIRRDRGVPLW